MRRGIMLVIAGLAFLAGCGEQGNKASNPPAAPKKVKAPYNLEFDAKAVKPNPAGVTLPAINYTATSKETMERRASLVVQLDSSATKGDQPSMNQMIMGPADTPDATGTLSAAYMDLADKGVAKMLETNCLNGKVKLNLALVRSSIKPDAGEGELNEKRLTEWMPTEVTFKNPHPKCK